MEQIREDLQMQIMRERLERGIKLVKEQADKHGMAMSQELFIKGLEVGVSLFIQKERTRNQNQ